VNPNWQFQSSGDHGHRSKQATRIKDGAARPGAFCTDEKYG
jgi:hypothetical protein